MNFLQHQSDILAQMMREQYYVPEPLFEDFLLGRREPLVLVCGAVPGGRVALFKKPEEEYLYLVPYRG
jgi:hypothetical protein